MQNFMLNSLKKSSKNLKKQKIFIWLWKFPGEPLAAIWFLFGFCWFLDTSGRTRNFFWGRVEPKKYPTAGRKISRISHDIMISHEIEAIQKNPNFVNWRLNSKYIRHTLFFSFSVEFQNVSLIQVWNHRTVSKQIYCRRQLFLTYQGEFLTINSLTNI